LTSVAVAPCAAAPLTGAALSRVVKPAVSMAAQNVVLGLISIPSDEASARMTSQK
jgi:hypothetical protein